MRINIYNEGKHNPALKIKNAGVHEKSNWITNHNHLSETGLDSADFVLYHTQGGATEIKQQVERLIKKYSKTKPILFIIIDDYPEITPLEDEDNIYITTAFNTKSRAKHQHWGAYPVVRIHEDWDRPRSLLANFIGSGTTYQPRELLKNIESENIKIDLMENNWWTIESEEERVERGRLFREAMEESLFCLCPRGNGPTSIRLVESILAGCIPVAIDDNTKMLDDDLDFCIRKSMQDINTLEEELLQIKNNKKELETRFAKMKHFANAKLDKNFNVNNELNYGDFIYNICKEYKKQTII
jgi:hypothetical protein